MTGQPAIWSIRPRQLVDSSPDALTGNRKAAASDTTKEEIMHYIM